MSSIKKGRQQSTCLIIAYNTSVYLSTIIKLDLTLFP